MNALVEEGLCNLDAVTANIAPANDAQRILANAGNGGHTKTHHTAAGELVAERDTATKPGAKSRTAAKCSNGPHRSVRFGVSTSPNVSIR